MCLSKNLPAREFPGCPCGRNPGPICNQAKACAICSYGSCGCATPGRIWGESELVCTHIVDVKLVKTVTPTCVRLGQDALYTVALRNCSSLPLQEVVLTDPQAAQLLQVGVIRVNGVAVGGNLATGIRIPAIGPGGVAVMTFSARPREGGPSTIENTAYANYCFATTCGGMQAVQTRSNPTVLTVLEGGIAMDKEVDRCYVSPEEPVVTYTLTARNMGSVALEEVVVTDQLPQRLEYVPGSTRINGDGPVDRNPEHGVHVGTIPVGGQATVEFRAELDCQ